MTYVSCIHTVLSTTARPEGALLREGKGVIVAAGSNDHLRSVKEILCSHELRRQPAFPVSQAQLTVSSSSPRKQRPIFRYCYAMIIARCHHHHF